MKRHLLRLAALAALSVAGLGFAQVNGTVNGSTNVEVKLRGVLRLDVDVTDVVFDFTDAAALAQDSEGRDKAGELALGSFFDGTASTYIFAPTSLADANGAMANDYGLATVTAGGNPQWTLKAKLDANFANVPNSLKISAVGQKEKNTATYTYATDAAISTTDATIATAVRSAPANAGANGISEMQLFFGYELDLATSLSYPTSVDENHDIVYSLTNP